MSRRPVCILGATHVFLPKTPFKAIFRPAGHILCIFSFQNYNFFPIHESI